MKTRVKGELIIDFLIYLCISIFIACLKEVFVVECLVAAPDPVAWERALWAIHFAP